MGAHPYFYFVKHQPDHQAALEELRQREFAAGRYNPVMPFINFPVDPNDQGPGAEHDTIEEAFEDADADGTRSILDLMTVGDEPDFGVAARLDDDALMEYFGTAQPTRETVSANWDFFEDIERGQGIYFVVYKNGKPDELYFAGYSYD
jgi:hypothetical protein